MSPVSQGLCTQDPCAGTILPTQPTSSFPFSLSVRAPVLPVSAASGTPKSFRAGPSPSLSCCEYRSSDLCTAGSLSSFWFQLKYTSGEKSCLMTSSKTPPVPHHNLSLSSYPNLFISTTFLFYNTELEEYIYKC